VSAILRLSDVSAAVNHPIVLPDKFGACVYIFFHAVLPTTARLCKGALGDRWTSHQTSTTWWSLFLWPQSHFCVITGLLIRLAVPWGVRVHTFVSAIHCATISFNP